MIPQAETKRKKNNLLDERIRLMIVLLQRGSSVSWSQQTLTGVLPHFKDKEECIQT